MGDYNNNVLVTKKIKKKNLNFALITSRKKVLTI